MRMGGKAQEPKPFDDQCFGPADIEPLSGPSQASGQGQPIDTQLLDMALQPAFRQGPSQGVHHGHERVAVHHT
jgi:hypothetical protein